MKLARIFFCSLAMLLAGIVPFGTASAVPITMQFEATGFVPGGAPETTVAGTIRWEAASPVAAIQNFLSIDLTIAGHQYGLGEIAFAQDAGNPNLVAIGGALGGAFGLQGNTDDFAIAWMLDAAAPPALMLYATTIPNHGGPFMSLSFETFSVTANATDAARIPEPGTAALLGLALGGVALLRRRAT